MSKVLNPEFLLPSLHSLERREETLTFPFQIESCFSYGMSSKNLADHVHGMEKILRRIIPEHLLSKTKYEFSQDLSEHIPLFSWTENLTPPDCLCIHFLCFSSYKNADLDESIQEILKKWLIPGKNLHFTSLQSLFFHWDLFPCETLFLMEVKVVIEEGKDLMVALQNLPSISRDISHSLKESKFKEYILKSKALSSQPKSSSVHKDLIYLLQKYPSHFDESLFIEMGRFFALTSAEFIEPRPHRLMSKIIAAHNIMRAYLMRAINTDPENRHLFIRYTKTKLEFLFGSKPVLGLIIALSLFDKHELFEESHILQAVQSICPEAQTVKGSFYAFQGIDDPIRTLYIEFEKKDGSYFSREEFSLFQDELEEELKKRIEKLVPSIFMIRNEEEVMRNLLILSQELKYLSDLPQVMISLDRQTATELYFTVILVRIQNKEHTSMQACFEKLQSSVQFLPDRVQQVGLVKKNHPKEANVFHLCIPKEATLLRADYSVNFYLARRKIATLLEDAIGPFRDYNGGMILKQGELFYQFRESFDHLSQKNHELLENFFFSLNPIETQATLPLHSLETLFSLFLEATKAELPKKEHYFLKIEEKKELLYAIIRTQEGSFKEELTSKLMHREFTPKSLIHTFVQFQGSLYTGLILQHSDPKRQNQFIEAVHQVIQHWKNKVKNQQILRLSFFDLPRSLDPRISGDEISCTIVRMLFEGLTRISKEGKPELGIAQSIEIAKDFRKYLFRLRKCYWSNGNPITAQDFEYAWKKIISPNFVTPFVYFFYPIKNAKAVNEGKCSIEDVGIKSIDASTLLIELEQPTPEFLELTAHTLYSPVHQAIDRTHPNWGMAGSDQFICNGPFQVKKIAHNTRYEFTKNHFYWDKEHVRLEQILISKDNSFIANEMFKNDEIEWLGKPTRAWEPFFEENKEESVSSIPVGVYWCIFNVEKFPFNHTKLRQAFDLAIDREELAAFLSNNDLPASTPLPLPHTMNQDPSRLKGNIEQAKALFEESLDELMLAKNRFPIITLMHANSGVRSKVAGFITQRWQQVFSVPCRAEGYEFHDCFTKLMKGDYQVGGMYWKSWINDPIYTLNAFKHRNHEINFAKWSNDKYRQLLDLAQQEPDPSTRLKYLAEAEKILIHEKPVIPIFYEKERNIKKPHVKNVFYSQSTGYVDFKFAFIER